MEPKWIYNSQLLNKYNEKTLELGIIQQHYQLQSEQDITNLINGLITRPKIRLNRFLVVINLLINYRKRLTIETKDGLLRLINDFIWKYPLYSQSFNIAKEMLMS